MNGQIVFAKNRAVIAFIFTLLLILFPLELFAATTDDPTLGIITGSVYNDANANGALDPDEVGIPDVTITLSDGTVTQSTLTNVNGLYRFVDLADGTYRLIQTDEEMHFSISDSDGDANGHNQIDDLIILNGNQITEQNFLDTIVYSSVGGLIFDDLDCDGTRGASEPGVAGIDVQLFQADGTLVDETASDEDGVYFFSDVEPGEYFMGFAVPEGQVPTMLDQGDDESLDSDVDPSTGDTPLFNLAAGQDSPAWDLGIASPAGFDDYIWLDVDHDGVRGENEEGVASVSINLYDGDDNSFIGTSITNVDGFFEFGGLPPGSYLLEFVPPAGFTFNPKVISGIDETTSRTDPFELHLTGLTPTWSVGLRQAPTSIELLDFSATAQSDGVQLDWRTGAEMDTFGFLLYRSTDAQFAHALPIQTTPISSQSAINESTIASNVAPFDYQFLDESALPNMPYTYWLVEVQIDGLTFPYGPISVETKGATIGHQLFLPLVHL